MIYKIGHRISILLNVQRKQKKGVDSKVIRTRRIVKVHDISINSPTLEITFQKKTFCTLFPLIEHMAFRLSGSTQNIPPR